MNVTPKSDCKVATYCKLSINIFHYKFCQYFKKMLVQNSENNNQVLLQTRKIKINCLLLFIIIFKVKRPI